MTPPMTPPTTPPTTQPPLLAPGADLDPGPRFPDDPEDRGGVAILGCGTIAHTAHLPAYQQYGVGVVGVWSRSPRTTAETTARFPFVQRVYDDVAELLADPRVRIVDVATGPGVRLDFVEAALDAGKHVLAQKPLVTHAAELPRVAGIVARAAEAGLKVAVNHNGRWAPPWRLATLLLRAGAVGEVVGVTHLHDKPLPPLAGTPFDEVPHMLLSDYLVHWIDITRCWLEDAGIRAVTARDSRVPGQPDAARNPWSATVDLACADGATATIRVVGDVRATTPGCPFWVHGTAGSLRGSVLGGSDRLTLDAEGLLSELPLHGAWFVDGFAAAMGELMCAVAEDREPEHSVTHAAGSARITLAARESAERGGVPVPVAVDEGGPA
jgi:predicted dehydrogenase